MIQLARTQAFYGLQFEGRSFDCGSKIGFLAANVSYALARNDIAPGFRAEIKKMLAECQRQRCPIRLPSPASGGGRSMNPRTCDDGAAISSEALALQAQAEEERGRGVGNARLRGGQPILPHFPPELHVAVQFVGEAGGHEIAIVVERRADIIVACRSRPCSVPISQRCSA